MRLSHRAAQSIVRPASSRLMSTVPSLTQRMNELVPAMREDFKKLKAAHSKKSLGDVVVDQAIGGGRDVKMLVYETSLLDAQEGIEFRGYNIPQLQKLLPKAPGGESPLPEGLLWLLLTGEIPSGAQVAAVTKDLHARSQLPQHVRDLLNSYPKSMHPMTQLSSAVLALQTESKFAKAYEKGVHKTKYWEYALEDTLDLIARLPEVAAIIYRNKFKGGKLIKPDANLDYAANFANMLGFQQKEFTELMRLYLTIHADHEGGNVSAHTTHLVGSALADPYLSFSAGMNGLAGPLHGLANQEVLRWLKSFKAEFLGDKAPTPELISEACWKTLNSGRVIPGYGHAVLRKTDPRYTCQREFALKYMPNDYWVKLVLDLYTVVPGILTKHGKTKNPWPNVDAHSGVLLQHFGLVEDDYYTVLFGVSRAIGVLSNLTISRALGMPLERPKSVTTKWLWDQFGKDGATPIPGAAK